MPALLVTGCGVNGVSATGGAAIARNVIMSTP